MLIPTLLGQGDAGFVFFGPARSGKSTFARAVAYLERGEEWSFPFGTNVRDHVSSLAGRGKITFFDDVDAIPKELQPLLKSKITHAKTEGRELYKDPDPNGELPSLPLGGTVIVCTTGFENKPKTDFLDRLFFIHFEKKGGTRGHDLLEYIRENHERARAGLIALFRKASKIPPPDFVLDEARYPDWAKWAYRYAAVLGVGKQFERYVRHANLEAMRASRFGFFVDFFTSENVKEGHPYRLADIYTQVYGPHPDAKGELDKLYGALRGLAAKKDIEAIAQAAGYRVRFERQTTNKSKGREGLVMLFEREPQTTPAEVREAMERRKQELRAEVGALPATPLPQNGHAPTPEVHTPPPAPQIALTDLPDTLSEVKQAVRKAPPAPAPAPVAAKSAPADVGDGVPMASPYAGTLTPAMQAYLRASDELTNLLTHPELRIVEPKEPELLLIIVETIKGVKKLRELFPLLRERDGDNIDALTLGYRTLYACMWGYMGILCGLATYRGLSLEGLLPHPKVGWAVVRRVLQELEGVLKGEEVSLWPLPELRKNPTDPEPTPPPIEPEPKWREAWELFAQIPPGHPARLAILKGLDPDPLLDWEYHTKHQLIRALLNGEAIDPPSNPPKNP